VTGSLGSVQVSVTQKKKKKQKKKIWDTMTMFRFCLTTCNFYF
jgi:hypothetical protein